MLLKSDLSPEKRAEKMLSKIMTELCNYIWDLMFMYIVRIVSKKFTSNLKELLKLKRTLEIM